MTVMKWSCDSESNVVVVGEIVRLLLVEAVMFEQGSGKEERRGLSRERGNGVICLIKMDPARPPIFLFTG